MANQIKVIDNFLDKEDFDKLKNTMLSAGFGWTINPHHDYKKEENVPKFFTHIFYDFYSFRSDVSEIIFPILEKISPISVLRIKANLFTKTENIVEYRPHIDYKNAHCNTAVFYVNNNNGYTYFMDGQKIESVENRLLVFNSEQLHSGSTCSDEDFRCAINLNYFGGISANENSPKFLEYI